MSYEIVSLVLGMLGIAAAWDVGRRYSDKTATQPLIERIADLESDLSAIKATSDDAKRLALNVKNLLETRGGRAPLKFG